MNKEKIHYWTVSTIPNLFNVNTNLTKSTFLSKPYDNGIYGFRLNTCRFPQVSYGRLHRQHILLKDMIGKRCTLNIIV
jgi:hypothetical protein